MIFMLLWRILDFFRFWFRLGVGFFMDRGKFRGMGSGRDRVEIVVGFVGFIGLRWGW